VPGVYPRTSVTALEQPPWFIVGPLAELWNRPVRELAHVAPSAFGPPERERHRIYSLLVMALVFHYWNGNKRGAVGDYPCRRDQRRAGGFYAGGNYLGHNIASIAVDGHGRLIDFDFNHNEIFCSSVEHAESRLVRRLFSLVQLRDDWRPSLSLRPDVPKHGYSGALQDVTIYTTLEPCAQCAGIMALGRVRAVIYIQRDPDMYLITHFLRNLTRPDFRAPLPVSADAFGFEYFEQLNDAYRKFVRDVETTPFFISQDGMIDAAPSVTSFLCTDEAKRLFGRASEELSRLSVSHRDFRPVLGGLAPAGRTLTNEEVWEHSKRFLEYALSHGHRGTPHRQ